MLCVQRGGGRKHQRFFLFSSSSMGVLIDSWFSGGKGGVKRSDGRREQEPFLLDSLLPYFSGIRFILVNYDTPPFMMPILEGKG